MNGAQAMDGNLLLMMLVGFVLVFMIFTSRSSKKREEQKQKVLSSLEKGDHVVIVGGIVGVVAGFKDEMIEVKISENTKITVLKNGIVNVLGKEPAEIVKK